MAYVPLETTEEVDNNADGKLHITFINVGKGDFIAIKTPLGRSIIVDAGSISREDFGTRDFAYNIFGYNEREMIKSDLLPGDEWGDPAFRLYPGGRLTGDKFMLVDYDPYSNHIISQNYNHLDYLFITHADQDHYNFIGKVINYKEEFELGQNVTIGDVFISDDWANYGADHKKGSDSLHEALQPMLKQQKQGKSYIFSNLHTLTVNDDEEVDPDWQLLLRETVSPASHRPEPVDIQHFRLYCLAAGAEVPSNLKANSPEARNCKSIVLLLEYGDDRILLTGDANIYTQDALKRALSKGNITPLTLMQIPHHGAANNRFSQAFIKSLAPKQAIISGPDALWDTAHNHPRFPAVYEADMAMVEGVSLHDDVVMGNNDIVSSNIHDFTDGFRYYHDGSGRLETYVLYPPPPGNRNRIYDPIKEGVQPIKNIEVVAHEGNYITVNYMPQVSILVTGTSQTDYHIEYNGA